MLVLAVDTATPAVTAGAVALSGDDSGDDTDARLDLLAQCVTVDAKAHGELLTPHIRAALDEAGHTLADVDALVCGVGPGPFTGLRAGMATAGALGHALGIPVYPVCTLDAIAADGPGRLLVASDARRKEVYWAAYDEHGTRTAGPAVDRPATLVERLPSLGVTQVSGNGATLYAFPLPHTGQEHPTPVGLVRAARAELLAAAPPRPLVPLYLRRPDAVEPGARKRVTAP